jgi:O-antigen/teichoic acid export membrane protein
MKPRWERGSSARKAMTASTDASREGQSYATVAVSGSAWTTLQTLLNKIATVFAMLVLAKLLEPADFGLANLAISVGSFAFIIAPFVMGDVLLASPSQFVRNAGTARFIAWCAGTILAVGLVVLANPIESFTEKPGLAFLLMFIVMQRPLADAAFVIPNSRLRINLAYKTITLIDGGVILFATLMGVAMAYVGMGPSSLLVPPIAMIWIRALLYRRAAGTVAPSSVDRGLIVPIAKRFMIASTGQYLNSVLAILEVFVLGFFASETEIGLYGFATMLAVQTNTIIASQLGAVLQPIFAHIRHDSVRQVAAFLRATRLLSSICVPLSLMQAALVIPLFQLFFEKKWTGSIAIFAALSVSQTFVFVSAPSISLLKAQGRFRAYFAWQFSQFVVSVVCFIFAIKFGQDIGARIASFVHLPVSDDARQALALSLASASMWSIFCPIGLWIAGRPSRLPFRTVLSVFFAPWIVAAPMAVMAVFAWLMLRASTSIWIADVICIAVIGPLAAVIAIAGSMSLRKDTRADIRAIFARFRRRKNPSAVQ